jgi:hypothetical protein
LDRHRLPLNGDEVRACWADGAIPVPPDPAMPGLLDLLTVRALGHPDAEEVAARDRGEAEAEADSGAGRRRSGAARTVSGSNRLWVEVEA